MKNIINKNKKSVDAMAEARNNKEFQILSKDVSLRLRLAVEIFNQREKLGLTQQDLAKKINSTQKVVSRVENGDVNVGFDLVNRIAKALHFTAENWSRIYDFAMPGVKVIWGVVATDSGSQSLVKPKRTEAFMSNSMSLIK